MDRERIAEAARAVLSGFSARVSAAYLYGSAARGGGPVRGIDVGLLVTSLPLDWGAEAAIASGLAERSGIHDVGFDVRILNGGDPVFLGNVLTDGVLLYEADREARIGFETEAMSRWLDFKPAWERVRADVLRRWAGE